MNVEPTQKAPEPNLERKTYPETDMRDEYDFGGGVRGKYAHRLKRGIQREMVPEHARETWDAEAAATGELLSMSKTQTQTQED